jgi:hypothetical protein
MLHTATREEKLKWAFTILTTNSPDVLLQTVDKIWEDGYRTAEAEVTYAITPEEVGR